MPSDSLYTKRQVEYLAFISQYSNFMNVPPSEGDIADYFSVSGPSAHQMVRVLELKGAISKIPGQARSILVIDRSVELPTLGWHRSSLVSGQEKEVGPTVGAIIEFTDFLAQGLCSADTIGLGRMAAMYRLTYSVCSGLRKHGLSEDLASSIEEYFHSLPWRPDKGSVSGGRAKKRRSNIRAEKSRKDAPRPERRSDHDDPRQGVLF
jgi:hypothetical protein